MTYDSKRVTTNLATMYGRLVYTFQNQQPKFQFNFFPKPRIAPSNDRIRITFCTDLDKSVLVNNFEKRGWNQVPSDDDWNFYWAGTQTCRNIFSVDSGYRMHDNQ